MKYNTNNKPLVCMQTQSTCYKGTTKMEVKGVLWHSTAANNPYLKRYVQPSDNAPDRDYWLKLLGKNDYNNDWNHVDKRVGMNCWIGKLADGTVTTVQTMPWDYSPWGCGAGSNGSCNNGWVQFEICEDSTNNKEYFDKIYQEACEITAYICDMYNLDPYGTVTYNGVKVPVILCHYDSHKLGLGSNHGDVYHWFNKYGKTMDDVRNDVAKLMNKNGGSSSSGTESAEFNVGDIVNFAGGTSYKSSDATSGSTAKACKAKITVKAEGAKHPYHLRAVNDNGAFISGVWGWVDANTVSAIKTNTATKPSTEVKIEAGTKLTLKNVPLYASSTASTKANTKTGTYYIWSTGVVNNRIRITNKTANVGKAGQVTGWIYYADAVNAAGGTTTSQTPQKTLDDWAREVILGKHGNGVANRTASLKAHGCPYTFNEVQTRVNQLV